MAVIADRVPEYRVIARNTSVESENKIHDDEVARRYGFRGGLVPGITVYAYLTHAIVELFGPDWLERGAATVKFVKPVIEGEEVLIAGRVEERGPRGVRIALTASTAGSGDCAVATASLSSEPPAAVDLSTYAVAPLPETRPEATREHLASLRALGTASEGYDEACARQYVEKISDDLPLYRETGAPVHPGFLLQQCNRALSRNVRVGPWIHTGSAVQHLGMARVGETVTTRGRVKSLGEKKGREIVELDLLLAAGSRPIAHVYHSAIYRLPSPASA